MMLIMLDRIFLLDVLRYLTIFLGVWWLVWLVFRKKSVSGRRRFSSRPSIRPNGDAPSFTGNRAPTSGAFDLLVNAVSGDMRKANRLVQYELSRAPGISRGEAIARAMDRLARDRS
ncbi:hypothetical protein ACDA63_06670 [Uliginosibacterium sp. sgz301328]|uniref:hypothetical protein n=1 Tax=Uliginosibacterium sp. sgz301328 TaxID=3243764 RepID=UPI00359DF686